MPLAYQLLALDPSKKTRCEDAASLLYLIRGFTGLWRDAAISQGDLRITDGQTTLSVVAVEGERDESPSTRDDLGRGFLLTLGGTYDDIEPFVSLSQLFSKMRTLSCSTF